MNPTLRARAATSLALLLTLGAAAPEAAPPTARRPFRHTRSSLVVAAGEPNHRGRDQIVPVGEPQWIIGKLAYGPSDKDLSDEDVDVLVQREGAAAWEPLGQARTSRDRGPPPAGAPTGGVPDSGGRVYFQVPAERALPPGRHRARLVVAGDGTAAELVLHVVPRGQAVVVSDVDGTLTTSEWVEASSVRYGETSEANPGAAELLTALAARGHVIVYLTARPEWLTARTRAFLEERRFPPGVLHTKADKSGALGDAAAAFKLAELGALARSGLQIRWALGNTPSDAAAYARFVAEPRRRLLYRFSDTVHRGRRVDDYRAVVPEARAATP